MKSYNQITKEALTTLFRIALELRNIDPNFDANKLLVFISVALQNGITAQTLANELNIVKTTMSGVVATLTPEGYKRGKEGNLVAGYGLLVQEPSRHDARAKELYLTFDGQQLVDRLIKIIEGNMDGT